MWICFILHHIKLYRSQIIFKILNFLEHGKVKKQENLEKSDM